jgi:hypothetical protein
VFVESVQPPLICVCYWSSLSLLSLNRMIGYMEQSRLSTAWSRQTMSPTAPSCS